MRAIDLPSGVRVILSDTVGFISDLPTQLVAAFRATLEEVLEADIIIHVRDIAHEDTDAQRDDVISVLADLGIGDDDERPVIEALTKIDLLDEDERANIFVIANASQSAGKGSITVPVRIAVSAETGDNVDNLQSLVEETLTAAHTTISIVIPAANGAARAWLHQRSEIIEELMEGDNVTVVARLSGKVQGQFCKTFPDAVIDKSENRERYTA